MNDTSIRAVVIREVALVLILLTLTMTFFTAVMQVQSESQKNEIRLNGFESTIVRDQDSLLLQLLLAKANDLNLYFEDLRDKFPSVRFCLDLNPPLPGLRVACQSERFENARELNLLGNRNHVIRFAATGKPTRRIIADLLSMPVTYSFALAAIIIALLLHFRMRYVVERPLTRLRRAINDLSKGRRSWDADDQSGGIAEWQEIDRSLRDLIGYILRLEKAENEAGQIKVARQVAHDIRSPLSMLRIAARVFTEIPPEKRKLLVAAVERIDEIIDSLDPRTSPCAALGTHHILPMVETVMHEKQILYADRENVRLRLEIGDLAGKSCARIDPAFFKRILSNLLNNAVEALSEGGTITVRLDAGTDVIRLAISDTGCGISSVDLDEVTKGKSVGKAGGQGLGLSHARATVESWGGSLTLESVEQIGTVLTLELPARFEVETTSVNVSQLKKT